MTRSLLILALSIAAAGLARAEDPPAAAPAAAADAQLDEAKRHFQQGVALYNDGNFSAALAEFEATYAAHPTAGVLYNIGLTQKSLFRYGESIKTLGRYLKEAGGRAARGTRGGERPVAEAEAAPADA